MTMTLLDPFGTLDHLDPDARLTITVVGYGYAAEWHVLINSLLLQTDRRWVAHLINDGPDLQARDIIRPYVLAHPDRLVYLETPVRLNDWGHTLRGEGLALTRTPLWATQNADNYLTPGYVHHVLAAFDEGCTTPLGQEELDIAIFPCVHNYEHVNRRGDPAYTVLQVSLARNRCDAGSIVVQTSRAQRVGWRLLGQNSDGDFITDLARSQPPPRVVTLPNVLMVHN